MPFTPIDKNIGFSALWAQGNDEQLGVVEAFGRRPMTETALMEFALDNPGLAATLKEMVQVLRQGGPAKGSVNDFRANLSRSERVGRTRANAQPVDVEAIMQVIDRNIIGQAHVRDAVRVMLEAWPDQPEKALPYVMGMAGPPGVGKTELFRALSLAIYGDPEAVAIIDCSKISKKHEIAAVFGAAPGLKGTLEEGEVPPMWRPLFEKQVNGRPKLVLFDELDKVGAGEDSAEARQEAVTAFSMTLGRFLEDGVLGFGNGVSIPLKDCVIGFASNAGSATRGNKEGEGLRQHFVDAFNAIVPPHIFDRLDTTLSFDPHTPETLAMVAKKIIDKTVAEELKEVRREYGIDAQMLFQPPGASQADGSRKEGPGEVLTFLGEIGYHPERGARGLDKLIKSLVKPMIRKAAAEIEDGERVLFELRDKILQADGTFRAGGPLDEVKKAQLKAQFFEAKASIPKGVNQASFPLSFRVLNPKPGFFEYQGAAQIPHDTNFPLLVYGSGAVNGRGFMVSQPHLDAPAALHFLRPGLFEHEDRVDSVRLPEHLEKAEHDLKAVALDDRQVMIYGVGTAKGGAMAEALAAIYDTKTKKWRDAAPPDLPLVGASLVAGNGKALLFGGRVQEKSADGSWAVDDDPLRMRGQPIENQAYVYDSKKDEWRWVQGPEDGLVGSATVFQQGKGYIIGGEETFRRENSQIDSSRASRRVLVFDFETETFAAGPRLPAKFEQGLAFGTAFADANGGISVVGGGVYLDGGRKLEPTQSYYRLSGGAWRSGDMPQPGLCLSALPQAESSWVIGPFRRDANTFGFDILRPRTTED
ncbi:MAG: AAA family ATPase [Deltaproteobacteria bacterium]|jgi:hypothetical protein|nr:AAA family ATPase [Deltaproteobacteria bacterium]